MKSMAFKEEKFKILVSSDVTLVIQEVLHMADAAGMEETNQFMVATAASELGTNILAHAQEGEIRIRIIESGDKNGIEIVAEDNGPGISDIELAMRDGFSTKKSLGLGLPGAKRLVDEFEIDTQRTAGTQITIRKWI
jgi:serine/threonine-protein kinase RsbT